LQVEGLLADDFFCLSQRFVRFKEVQGMKTKSIVMAMVALVAVLLAAVGAQAGTAVEWATGGAFIKNLGNTHHTAFSIFPPESNRWDQDDTECDKVTLGIASGSLDLTPGVPRTVVINPLTFEVGWTGDMLEEDTKTNVYYLSRDITVNGITKTLINPVTHGVTWAADSLMVQAGEPVTFGNIVVTPLGWDPNAFFAENYGVFTQTSPSWHTISPVYAEFRLIEAPSASVILVPEKLSVPRGSTVGVSVDMTLLSPITLAAISTNILFDTSVFTYDVSPALAKGSFLTHDWDLYGNEFAAGHARVGGIDMNMDPWYESLAAGTGRLFTFTLKVKNDAPLGPSTLTWGVYDGGDNATAGFDYGDADFNDILLPESALSGASINVVEEIPTAITLASFDAKAGNGKVTLTWVTGDETDNLGFNIYRADSKDGSYVKINASLIASRVGSGLGTTYEFTDSGVKNRTTCFYKLEDVDVNGVKTMHGPVSATPRLLYAIIK
jgi:hypothetical protein